MHHSAKKFIKNENLIALIGNPNVGKSVIFGILTGKYVTVSNYPGTTVEVSSGHSTIGGKKYFIVDTPGVNNLIPTSEDEQVTRDILLENKGIVTIQVADAKNLSRALLISIQMSEMEQASVIALNMNDEALERGISIDCEKLSEILGVEAISTVATQKKGLDELKKAIIKPKTSVFRIDYGEEIENGIFEIEAIMPKEIKGQRALALMVIAGDETLNLWLQENFSKEEIGQFEKIRDKIQINFSEPLRDVIVRKRLREASKVLKQVQILEKKSEIGILENLGKWSMHPFWGMILGLVVLFGIYEFVGVFGAGTIVDFFENVIFGKAINPFFEYLFGFVPIKFIQELFIGEYGLFTMALSYSIAIVLPIVGTFFIAFGILEDSGYLPRLAVMMNRVFKGMGLNGKAVLPMVLGLGCDTMATLTTRILDTKKERIVVTLLLALGVPCSAQLGVILGMLGALSVKATILWMATIVIVLFVVGFLASKILPGKGSDFVLEIPPIRIPKISNILVKTFARIEWYLKEAVPLFFLGTFVLFLLDKLALLEMVEKLSAPIVKDFLGLPEQAAQAFLIGFMRRDYGAAGLFDMASKGLLDPIQSVVSLVTITLFVPCIANFFIIIKERGLKSAIVISMVAFFIAFLVGGILNFTLHFFGVSL